jgi:methionyl-tRNA formyltransferase
MKILFLGTPDSAVPILEKLITTQHQVVGVITQPARKSGRGLDLKDSAVAEFAKQNSLNVFSPEKIDKSYFDQNLKPLDADMAIVVAFGQILSKEVLNELKFGWINIHYSLLPKFRGAAPVQRAILIGEKETGISFFAIEEGLDTGSIIKSYPYQLSDSATTDSVLQELNVMATQKIEEIITGIQNGSFEPVKQTGEVSTAPKLNEIDLRIDWNELSSEINRKVRAGNKRLSAWTTIADSKIKILSISESTLEEKIDHGQIRVINKIVNVGCKNGSLIINEVIPEGKKQMDAYSWINGFQDKSDLRFS